MQLRPALRPLWLLAALLATAWAPPTTAAGLRVVPLKLEMTAKLGSATLQLTNLTAQQIAVQLDAKAWTQVNGADQYSDTKDLLFAPPIVAIAAGKTKTVRFRLRRGAALDRELAYRIYVQQLAAAPGSGSDGSSLAGGVEVRLRLGLPLFVGAVQPVVPALQVAAEHQPDGRSALRLANPGAMHLKITQAQVLDASGKLLATAELADSQTNYLLAGSSTLWPLHAPQGAAPVTLPPGRYQLKFASDYYAPRGSPLLKSGFASDGLITLSLDVAH